MPEQLLNRTEVRAIREQVGGKRVAQGMRVQIPVNVREPCILLNNASNRTLSQTAACIIQEDGFSLQRSPPANGTSRPLHELFAVGPVSVQCLLSLGAVKHNSLLIAFASHVQDTWFPLDVSRIETGELANTQACSVKHFEDRAIPPR